MPTLHTTTMDKDKSKPATPKLTAFPSGQFIRLERVLWANTIEEYMPNGDSAFVIHYDNGHELVLKYPVQIEEMIAAMRCRSEMIEAPID